MNSRTRWAQVWPVSRGGSHLLRLCPEHERTSEDRNQDNKWARDQGSASRARRSSTCFGNDLVVK